MLNMRPLCMDDVAPADTCEAPMHHGGGFLCSNKRQQTLNTSDMEVVVSAFKTAISLRSVPETTRKDNSGD